MFLSFQTILQLEGVEHIWVFSFIKFQREKFKTRRTPITFSKSIFLTLYVQKPIQIRSLEALDSPRFNCIWASPRVSSRSCDILSYCVCRVPLKKSILETMIREKTSNKEMILEKWEKFPVRRKEKNLWIFFYANCPRGFIETSSRGSKFFFGDISFNLVVSGGSRFPHDTTVTKVSVQSARLNDEKLKARGGKST